AWRRRGIARCGRWSARPRRSPARTRGARRPAARARSYERRDPCPEMMSAPEAADYLRVINRLLTYVSIACCALVVVSFGLFARDQVAGASEHQQTELAAGLPATAAGASSSSHAHRQPRRLIDGVAGALESPFKSIVSTHSEWVQHIFPALFALLVYGLGL